MKASQSSGVLGEISDKNGWRLGVLIILTALAYLPVWRAGFIWDDDTMLTGNPLIRAGDGLYRFWGTTQPADYWPVTYTSFWIEWRLWGLHALGYHLTNLILHGTAAGLLWSILQRLRIPGAWWAALWFAVHPLNVESVSWIAQRKNVLAMLFYLASIWCFLKTDLLKAPEERSAPSRAASGWYWLSLFAFVLAMLSKGSVATLPAVLAGLILWRRRPAPVDGWRLAPFCAVAVIFAGVSVWFQRHGVSGIIRDAGFFERLLGAGGVIWFYLSKSIWPADLMFVYPQWRVDPANLAWWLPLIGAVALTGALLVGRRTRAARFAWGYFCLMLLPVLGFTDVYFMKYSLVADHYAHLALIGMVAWAAFAGCSLHRSAGRTGRQALTVLAWVATGLLAWRTWSQNRLYRDNLTLFQATLAQNPHSWMVHTNLGKAWMNLPGRLDDAIAHYAEAVRLEPDNPKGRDNLGNALVQMPGRLNDAVAQLREVVRLVPDNPEGRNDLGYALAQTPAQLTAAIEQYQAALRLRPDFADAHNNLGNAWAGVPGRLNDAIAEFEAAVRLSPDFAEAHNNLGNALSDTPGRLQDAIAQYRAAARLAPNNPAIQFNLQAALQRRQPGQP